VRTYDPLASTSAITTKTDSTQIKSNLISNIYVINSFLELVRNGKEKKIIFISSPSGDVEFTRVTGLSAGLGYSVSKAGMNIVATKFGAELAQDGIKTLSLSPGWVNTDAGKSIRKANRVGTEYWLRTARTVTGEPAVREYMLNAFRKLGQTVNGPVPVDESVTDMLQVIQSLTEANSGKFVTHHGNNDEWF
jgi:NAD(P)-dependent dehydrogenase (short-subunit alcohol dehydrogenase family)